jgi:Restriction endonuclease
MKFNMVKDKTGRSLEECVGRLQQMLDPRSIVTYRERIPNRLGILREFDVVIRGTFGGHAMLGIIECKDWAGKVGTPELDAFITKSDDINANLRLIVSPMGFTAPALAQAKDAGIGVYSLLPVVSSDAGFKVGVLSYGRLYEWVNIRLETQFSEPVPDLNLVQDDPLLYDGKPVYEWFLKELSARVDENSLGQFSLRATFDSTVTMTIGGSNCNVVEIVASAKRIMRIKRRFVQMSGDAIVDWHTKTAKVPASGKLFLGWFQGDLSDWQDHEGDIPNLDGYQFVIDVEKGHFEPLDEDIPDLSVLRPRLTESGPLAT